MPVTNPILDYKKRLSCSSVKLDTSSIRLDTSSIKWGNSAIKCCPKCKREKDSYSFQRDKLSPDGLGVYCIQCIRTFIRGRLREAIKRHNRRFPNSPCNITEDYLLSIFSGYCGLTKKLFTLGKTRIQDSPSLDRIDNNRGYVRGNVMWVLKVVNYSKFVFTLEDWLNGLTQIREAYNSQVWLKHSNDISISLLHECCPVLGIPLEDPKGNERFRPNTGVLSLINPELRNSRRNFWCISFMAHTIKQDFSIEQITGDFFETLIANLKKLIATKVELEQKGLIGVDSPASSLKPLESLLSH